MDFARSYVQKNKNKKNLKAHIFSDFKAVRTEKEHGLQWRRN